MIVNVKTGNAARLGLRKEINQSALEVKYLIGKKEERSQEILSQLTSLAPDDEEG